MVLKQTIQESFYLWGEGVWGTMQKTLNKHEAFYVARHCPRELS